MSPICRWCGVRLLFVRDTGVSYCERCDTTRSYDPFMRPSPFRDGSAS